MHRDYLRLVLNLDTLKFGYQLPFRAYSEILNNLKLFSGVPVEERDQLLSRGHIHHLREGEHLFNCGDAIDHFYIVCSGAVRLTRETPDGKEVTTDISYSGKTIGKSDIFERSHKYHRATAVAVEDVTVLEFPTKWLLDIAKNPAFALNILSAISEYAHVVELEAEQRSTMTAAQRLACFLQRLCIMHGFDATGFELPYSKALIASRLGMKPETFSRTLTTLYEHGVSITDTRVVFHDLSAIEQFVCEYCSMIGECRVHDSLSKKRHLA